MAAGKVNFLQILDLVQEGFALGALNELLAVEPAHDGIRMIGQPEQAARKRQHEHQGADEGPERHIRVEEEHAAQADEHEPHRGNGRGQHEEPATQHDGRAPRALHVEGEDGGKGWAGRKSGGPGISGQRQCCGF